MVASFRRARKGGVTITMGQVEHQVLQHVLSEMLQLVSVESGGDAEDDPLARAVGIGTATEAPEDPALARLFPDGYTDAVLRHDLGLSADAVADFRRRQVI